MDASDIFSAVPSGHFFQRTLQKFLLKQFFLALIRIKQNPDASVFSDLDAAPCGLFCLFFNVLLRLLQPDGCLCNMLQRLMVQVFFQLRKDLAAQAVSRIIVLQVRPVCPPRLAEILQDLFNLRPAKK